VVWAAAGSWVTAQPVFAAGEADGALFIAMRYVPSGDLRALVRRAGPLSPPRAAAIVSSVASALDAAHSAGLVHRDVKPSNILVDAHPGRPDHVYLSDFGLSGAPVFPRDQITAVIWAHMSIPPPPLTSRQPGLPAAVDAVLAKALAKALGDRYRSCREFADAAL
jgi:serine/threonine protein kinase